jgi:hypothetical protein
MPKVGNKHFPYTPAGKAAAKAASKKSGKPMTNTKENKTQTHESMLMKGMMGGQAKIGRKKGK